MDGDVGQTPDPLIGTPPAASGEEAVPASEVQKRVLGFQQTIAKKDLDLTTARFVNHRQMTVFLVKFPHQTPVLILTSQTHPAFIAYAAIPGLIFCVNILTGSAPSQALCSKKHALYK